MNKPVLSDTLQQKIDENFSEKEEIIIKKTISDLGAKKENVEEILNQGKEIENNSNQILDFTKKVKNMNENKKIQIIIVSYQKLKRL